MPTYQAQVWSPRDQRPIRKTFPSIGAAKAWRQQTQVALRAGRVQAPTAITLEQAARQWLEAARAGVVRTRSGDPYKPSALRSYQQALQSKLIPALGKQRLSSVSAVAIQDLIDQLIAQGLAPSTIRNTILPLRAIYRRAATPAICSRARTRHSGRIGRNEAEGEGFEPSRDETAPNGFRDRRIRPLCHPSGAGEW